MACKKQGNAVDYHIAAYRLNKLIYKMHKIFEQVTS